MGASTLSGDSVVDRNGDSLGEIAVPSSTRIDSRMRPALIRIIGRAWRNRLGRAPSTSSMVSIRIGTETGERGKRVLRRRLPPHDHSVVGYTAHTL